jgi:activator of HSP90 ATPase
MYSESSDKTAVKDLVRSQLTTQLRGRFQQLGPALMNAHGKDIQHAAGHQPAFTPTKVYSSSSVTKSGDDSHKSSSNTASTSNGNVNVTSLSDQQEFRCDAPMLYQILTDPQRIAAFTREPPKVFEGANPGGKFEIFGGNVSGEYVELSAPTKIVQKWRLAQWPQGHFSTLNIAFEQNNVDAVTIMRVNWTGVPVGEEEATKRNWENYYVRSMKQTFGIGSIL